MSDSGHKCAGGRLEVGAGGVAPADFAGEDRAGAANPSFNAENLAAGDHSVEVRYTDMTGKVNSPYQLRFNTAASARALTKQALNQFRTTWLTFRDYEGKSLLCFTAVLAHRGSLKTIRYSLDGDALDRTWSFKPPAPGEAPYSSGEGLPYIEVPGTTPSQPEFSWNTRTARCWRKMFPRP